MIRLLEPADIFKRTSFQEDVDYLEYPKISFSCNGGSELLFSMKHFKKNALLKHSNLSLFHRTEIDKYVKAKIRLDYNSYLDFYCPKDGAAVRIYYQAWAGGRFTSGYDIKFVIMLENIAIEEE